MSAPRKSSLIDTHPEIAKQADGWDPRTVSKGSDLKKKWKCARGHKWEAKVVSRTSRGTGCPFCSGHRVWAGFNDLATFNPDLATEADGWDPRTVSKGSDLKKKWKCARGHKWEATVSSRAIGKTGCPACSNQKIIAGENDLGSRFPEVADQAFGWDPSTKGPGSNEKVQWQCSLGHLWFSTIRSRTRQKLGCPYCSGQKVMAGFNDLATTHPNLLSHVVHGSPTSVSRGSRTKFTWKCDNGHLFDASVFNVTNGKWCPYCSGQKVMAGFNDFATKYPELATEALGWDPTTKSFGSGEKVQWKCPLGHIYSAQLNSRGRGSGCPFCSGNQLLIGFNDLSTRYPNIAREACGWNPNEILAGSTKRLVWKCSLGHTWKVSPSNRIQRTSGCPICSGLVVLKGFNDLQTKFPSIASEASGWDPSVVSAHSHSRKRWLCEYGHSWTARVSGRTHMGAGCPSCAKGGFDPNKAGFLYFLIHNEMNLYKIGISNKIKTRLQTHAKSGWVTIEVRGPMDGHLTQKLENDCLHALEKRGAILAHKSGSTKFDGYTEAWTKASLYVTSIKQILDWVYEDDTT